MGNDHFGHAVQPMANRHVLNSRILRAVVTLLEEQVMLTPRSETNLSQRRRTQSLAGKYLLGTQRDFSQSGIGFGLSITADLSFENLYPS